MSQIKLTDEERKLLEKLPLRSLHFFRKIANDVEFKSFQEVTNYLIDLEKNQFFTDGIEHEPQKLAINHAFSRGGIGMIIKFLHLIVASSHELSKREEARKMKE